MVTKIYNNLEEVIGSLLLVGACMTTSLQVVSRYVLGSPLTWTAEASTFMFVGIVFLGAALALKRREHFVLEFFVNQLPARASAVLGIITDLLTTVAAFLLLWYGGKIAAGAWDVITPALELPRAVPLLAVCAGGGLMVIRSIENLFGRVQALREQLRGGA